jgi:hypothetical protein
MEPGNPMLDDQVLSLAATPSCFVQTASGQ